jgi:hypothetical protein
MNYIMLHVLISFKITAVQPGTTILCEFKGYDFTIRIRQLIVLVEPYEAQNDLISTHSILHNNIEMETLQIFKFIASQVCTIGVDLTDGASSENIDLKEHMVGVLFSRNNFTHLQKQVSNQSMIKRPRLSWSVWISDNESFDIRHRNRNETIESAMGEVELLF